MPCLLCLHACMHAYMHTCIYMGIYALAHAHRHRHRHTRRQIRRHGNMALAKNAETHVYGFAPCHPRVVEESYTVLIRSAWFFLCVYVAQKILTFPPLPGAGLRVRATFSSKSKEMKEVLGQSLASALNLDASAFFLTRSACVHAEGRCA